MTTHHDLPAVADPDRLFPADPTTRAVARELFALVEKAPILSPHGHVEPRLLADDVSFTDAATLLVTPDHYVTRLLHANGVGLDRLRPSEDTSPRDVWRAFCAGWPAFAGTASGYWIASELHHVLGVGQPSEKHADALFDDIGAVLARPDHRPRSLFRRFGIEVLATTDDPLDPLDTHARLAAAEDRSGGPDAPLGGRVIPTFRPDRYLAAGAPAWSAAVDELIAVAGDGHTGYVGYLTALANRRAHFVAHGAVSADHGVATPETLDLDPVPARELFDRLRATPVAERDPADVAAFEQHMLVEMARMSVDDGLVMTLHPGIHRNHHPETFARYGPDTGHDIPVRTDFTAALRPLLSRFGTEPGFHLVLFTTDETTFSRELAPLAGFYPSVYLGAPWWFLDSPYAIRRFREAVTETAGFSRSSGFVDDTRAFLSIPVRHDAARRVEAGVLARLVTEHRITQSQAAGIIVDLVDATPRRVFKLPSRPGA
ncbi:glucuronate isomerase [Micromonospora sp. R77]|uniref:glucuronate isomerase n=1 Tax=Micromonospora sp. R77 TaxID=2925836 RepID=UPI001F61ADF5|nr:glucuronate isomerase [Micromonospora sp. R77]MCI4066245.1 glucuronate isomerase [Micromonospora sp. R77]